MCICFGLVLSGSSAKFRTIYSILFIYMNLIFAVCNFCLAKFLPGKYSCLANFAKLTLVCVSGAHSKWGERGQVVFIGSQAAKWQCLGIGNSNRQVMAHLGNKQRARMAINCCYIFIIFKKEGSQLEWFVTAVEICESFMWKAWVCLRTKDRQNWFYVCIGNTCSSCTFRIIPSDIPFLGGRVMIWLGGDDNDSDDKKYESGQKVR